MTIEEIRATISDMTDAEPKSFGSDREANEAAQWIDIAKKTENEANELLEPAIKEAFAAHRALTGEKNSLLSSLFAVRDRVRVNLANWIGAGHDVKGCSIQSKYRVTVTDVAILPNGYLMTVPNMDELQKWVDQTEGSVAIPGCEIERVNILFSKRRD